MPDTGRPDAPDFDRAPVIETVLGVHFRPVRGITAAHLGLFWSHLGIDHWPKASEQAPILAQVERFDVSPSTPMQFNFEVMDRPEVRLRLSDESESKVVQVQRDLLLTHWVKRGDANYPRYARTTRPDFLGVWQKWCEFLGNWKPSPPLPLQWEVTYINRVSSGALWTTPGDLRNVFRDASVTPRIPDGTVESVAAQYHYRLSNDRGRLHVAVRHVKGEGELAESLEVTLTARGAFKKYAGAEGQSPTMQADVMEGLDFGRSVVTGGFEAMTSEKAHAIWGTKVSEGDADA